MYDLFEGVGLELSVQIVSFLLAILGLPFAVTKLRDLGLSRRARLSSEAALLVQRVDQCSHPLEIQLGFYTLFARRLTVEEIIALLDLQNPLDMIEKRLAYSEAVEYVDGEFRWRGCYRNEYVQKYASKGYAALYVVLASVALFCWWLASVNLAGVYIILIFVLAVTAASRSSEFAQIVEFMLCVDKESKSQ